MFDRMDEYRLQEMKMLREEILTSLEQLHKWENFVLVTIGAMYAGYVDYIAKVHKSGDAHLLSPILGDNIHLFAIGPIAIVLLGFFRSTHLSNMIRIKDNSLSALEERLSQKELKVIDKRKEWKDQREDFLNRSSFVIRMLILFIETIRRLGAELFAKEPKHGGDLYHGWVDYYYSNRQLSYLYRDLFWSILLSCTTIFMLFIYELPQSLLAYARASF